mmetsp:Transcript_11203/g.19658  ORF Transcript_11203/g.19658 Transcript_11203/m.19658 type:complete len:681 (-) Transcript_11203:142-2184(-)
MVGLTDEVLQRHFDAGDFDPAQASSLTEESARPIRRLLWARLLKVTSGSLDQWAEQLESHRAYYRELKEAHRRECDVKKHDPSVCNPLSKAANNPLLKLQANADLLQEIWKDVERTYPEMELFQNDKCRRCMQQVLFHWCRACNPATDAAESYRQGMNELVALCMYVVLQGQYSGSNANGLCARLCAEVHNEADTFNLFSALMESGGLREMFAVVKAKPQPKNAPKFDIGDASLMGRSAPRTPPSQPQSAVLARCDHIYNTLLKKLDIKLHTFLVDQGIEPQIFMLRWLRLLFCREFHIDDTIPLWTLIFADANAPLPEVALMKYNRKPGKGKEGVDVAEASSLALPLVDFFAVAMILYLKGQLLSLDESGCLQRLMKFPPVESVRVLIDMAKDLRMGGTPPSPSKSASTPAEPQVSLTFQDGRAADDGSTSTSTKSDSTSPTTAGSATVSSGYPLQGAVGGLPDHSTGHPQLAEFRRKIEKLEQEKLMIANKGRQFIAQKTAEYQGKIAELERRLAAAGGSAPESDFENEKQAAVQAAVATAKEELKQHLHTAVAKAKLEAEEQASQQWSGRVAELEARLAEAETARSQALAEAQKYEQQLAAAEAESKAAATAASEASERAADLERQLAAVQAERVDGGPAEARDATPALEAEVAAEGKEEPASGAEAAPAAKEEEEF